MDFSEENSGLPSQEEQESAREAVCRALGYSFKDQALLQTALSHRSYVHQVKETSDTNVEAGDYQRLEFLGDAVLGLCISTLLYHKFPKIKEGALSRMRAGLVNEIQLADMAREIGLPGALLLGRGEETTGGRDKNSILADSLEGVIAAVYLDGGFPLAMSVVQNLWGDLIARSSKDDLLKDFKTRLQERTQKTLRQTPEYRLTKTEGPDHARTFEVTLVLEGEEISRGRGCSKKEAEQAAARTALARLKGMNRQASEAKPDALT